MTVDQLWKWITLVTQYQVNQGNLMQHNAIVAEVRRYLEEDIGTGDLTAAIIPKEVRAEAEIITREDLLMCGQAWVGEVFTSLDKDVQIDWFVEEGEFVNAGALLCRISGMARAMLTAERTALNILQTLSATATLAQRFAQAVSGTGCKVLDTRKTIPGLRNAQKYAVKCGGCCNHRTGLFDGVLIKENHIIAAGSIALAVKQARQITSVSIEVEVENLEELQQALLALPDRIMLDNFSLDDLKKAVAMTSGRIDLEASGNISLHNIREIAETGVDYISIGALTKHVTAIDLSMRIKLDT